MQRTIDLRDLREQLSAVLRAVTSDQTLYVIAQDGRPEAAIVPYETFVRLTDSDGLGIEPSDDSIIDAALTELDAVRAHIDTLEWDGTDSTEILRRLREGADEA